MKRALVVLALVAATSPLAAQQGLDTVTVRAEKLTDKVYVLFGAGGNIGLSVGNDQAFVIDDQFAPLTEKIKRAIATVTDKPVRFVVNTHWHGDHSGGNENMANGGAVIVAQDNVRKRMSTDQFNKTFNSTTKASPHAALPIITFADGVTFHVNDDSIVVTHVPPAHTDGDAIIYFRKANVLHAGDTFFNGMYPYVDLSSGGSVAGVLDNADRMLGMADDNTKIIPGHGPIATRADLKTYRNMLYTVVARIRAEVAKGRTLEQVVAAKPTKEFDAKFGGGFMKPDIFVQIAYASQKGATTSTGKSGAHH